MRKKLTLSMQSFLGSRALAGPTRLGVDLQQRRRYGAISSGAEVSPWRVLWIDPQEVRHTPTGKNRYYPKLDRVVSHVLGGDWDLKRRDFWASEIAHAIYRRIVDGADWEDTALVGRLTRDLSVPGAPAQWHGCRTPTDVLARCARIDRLVEEIRSDGYRAPSRIRPGQSGLTRDYPPDAVSIGIGREGDLMHLNGIHRLSIAKSLGLTGIPVRVGIRHSSWQSRRIEHLRAPGPLADHPDIAFMLDEFRASRISADE